MAFEGVSAAGGEGWFPQHPKTGPWESLKGGTLGVHMQVPLTSTAQGDTRHIADAGGTPWDSQILVTTGLTRGGGTMVH